MSPKPRPTERTHVGYIRVSTEDQAREGVSLAAQREKIEGYGTLRTKP